MAAGGRLWPHPYGHALTLLTWAGGCRSYFEGRALLAGLKPSEITVPQAADIAFVLLTEAFTLGIPNAMSGGMHTLSAIEKVQDFGVSPAEAARREAAKSPTPADNDAAMAMFGGMMAGTGFKGVRA